MCVREREGEGGEREREREREKDYICLDVKRALKDKLYTTVFGMKVPDS